MSVQSISTDDLRRMRDKEGLILMGCGGEAREWLDGINDLLKVNGILLDGTRFETAAVFQYKDLTCMLYPFEDVKLDMGKLAMWRLQTHSEFGGTWLSDFVPNQLGGYIIDQKQEHIKPDCPLIGQDGNVFNLIGIASRTLKENGMPERAKEMTDRVFASGSYGEALCIIGEYVNITDSEHAAEQKPSIRTKLKAERPQAQTKPETVAQQER